MSDIGQRHRTFRALREELAEQAYMTVADVARYWGMSESWVRELPDAILPAVNTTVGSQQKTRRFRPDDVQTLGARMRAWELADAEGREATFLEDLREQWRARDRQEMESVLEGIP